MFSDGTFAVEICEKPVKESEKEGGLKDLSIGRGKERFFFLKKGCV